MSAPSALWVAFFRGINVGGHGRLPMKALVPLMEAQGCTDVRTYIQSGNVVFRHEGGDPPDLERRIAQAVEAGHGFRPRILILSADALAAAVEANPFPQAAGQPKSVHLYFLAEAPAAPDLQGLEELRKDSEAYVLKGRVLYLHTPQGYGTSRLAAGVERLLGVEATARNWRTVTSVLELAGRAV